MRLQIISPYKIIFDGECTMLEYNTTEGYVGVLPGHIAMTQIVAPGKLAVYEDGKEKPMYAALISGIVKIMPDLVTVLAEIIDLKENIDVDRAKESKARAEKRLADKIDDLDVARAERAITRANIRLAVAELN